MVVRDKCPEMSAKRTTYAEFAELETAKSGAITVSVTIVVCMTLVELVPVTVTGAAQRRTAPGGAPFSIRFRPC